MLFFIGLCGYIALTTIINYNGITITKESITMSAEEQTLFKVIEQLLDLANEAAEEAGPDLVNSALLQAAARYNAFIVAANSDDLRDEKPSAVSSLVTRYKEMLADNIDDFIENPLPKVEMDD